MVGFAADHAARRLPAVFRDRRGRCCWSPASEPAHALNLASAVEARGRLRPGRAASPSSCRDRSPPPSPPRCCSRRSYTFWSQAVIAEVYALHIVFVALTLLLLLRWATRPTAGAAGAFFAVYALGFGNHLSMILLLPALRAVSAARPRRAAGDRCSTPRVVALATAVRAPAARCSTLWNLRALWLLPDPPHGLARGAAALLVRRHEVRLARHDGDERAARRCSAITLRDVLVRPAAAVRRSLPAARGRGPGRSCRAATGGAASLMLLAVRRPTSLFAYSYNVGDTHVFYLPSHLMLALLAAPGTACSLVAQCALDAAPAALRAGCWRSLLRRSRERTATIPALDRSRDTGRRRC